MSVTRVFCGNCGSAISHRSVAFGENAAIQTGNFRSFADKPVAVEREWILINLIRLAELTNHFDDLPVLGS